MAISGDAVTTIFSSGWKMTFVTFFVCPLRIATTCSVSLLNTVAFLSLPPVNILLLSELLMSNDKIPGTLAECKPGCEASVRKLRSLSELTSSSGTVRPFFLRS